MKTMFLSRKNLVVIAIAVLFTFNYLLIGILLCVLPEFNNLIWSLGFDIIETKYLTAPDITCFIFSGIFLFLLVLGFIYVYRIARIKGYKFFHRKTVLALILFIVIWFIVAFFSQVLVELFDFNYFFDVLIIELVTLLITLVVSLVLAIPLGALIMIIVNFVNMGRPYGFFAKELMPDFGDENEETNVSKSFDKK